MMSIRREAETASQGPATAVAARSDVRGTVWAVLRGLGLALVFLFAVGVVTQASAQPADDAQNTEASDDEDRSTAFRSVSGPELDRVPGGQLLIAAYGLAWLAIAGFMWRRIGRLQSAAAKDLARLTQLIEARSEAKTPGFTKTKK